MDAIDFTALAAQETVPEILTGDFDNGDALVEERLKELGMRYLEMIKTAREIVEQETE